MNNRNTLKRIALGAFVLGLSGTIAFSAFGPQADAAARHAPTPETRKEGIKDSGDGKQQHHHKRFFLLEDASAIIGIDQNELRKQLMSGKSLAEIAKTKGIQEADLINKLMAIRTQKIDEAVKSGKWTQEKADHIKQKLPEHLKRLVNKKDWKDGHKDNEHKPNQAKETQSDEEAMPD